MTVRANNTDGSRRSCKYPHCRDEARTRGFCDTHYRRYKKARQTLEGERKLAWCHPYDFHCVYVVGCDEFPYVKIGRTNNVAGRVEALQCSVPYKLKIYGARFSHPEIIVALEYLAHKALVECDSHYRAEWFNIDPKDAVAVLDKCASINSLQCYTPSDYNRLCKADMGAGLERHKRPMEDEKRAMMLAEIEHNI